MALIPGTRFGVYEVAALLGAGGMGEVYRARDTKLGRDVAIKVLPESFSTDGERLARFQREAKTLAALNHPNIAHIHGFEDSTGVPALVMELVEGPTLADRIARGPIPIEDALPIAKQIAEALEAAHEQGIIHRDLKPANIKVRPDGTVKVLDFGLAKALDPAAASDAAGVVANSPTITSPAQTERGVILGTAAYMSPEQAKGRPAGKRSDLWSFGCVLYEMLTGTRTFPGEDVSDTLAAVLRGEPNWTKLPPATPPEIRRLLRRALAKDRNRRLDSAADARLEIDDASSGVDAIASAIDGRRRGGSWGWLPWALAGALGAGLAAVLLIAWPRLAPSTVTRATVAPSRDNSLTIEAGTAISPDGRIVAFVARSPQGSRSLYVRRLDEWEPRALPSTEGAIAPFFSPDGRWIAFFAGGHLSKIPVAGGAPQAICKAGAYGGRWRSDGTIVFGDWPNVGLWRVSSDGGTPQLITRPQEGSAVRYLLPEVLPGDKGILFTVWREGRTHIEVLAPGANQPRVLVESGAYPRYLPTGHLVYEAGGRLIAARFDVDRLEIHGGPTVMVDDVNDEAQTAPYDISQDGTLLYYPVGSLSTIVWKTRQGTSVPIVTRPRHYEWPALSRDGERFSVVVREGPSRNIWIGNVADGLLTPLTFGNDDWYGTWSNDGARLYYLAGQNGTYNIFSIRTDGGGKAERLTQSPDPQNPTSLSPSGDTLLFNDLGPMTGPDIWEYSLSRKTSRALVQTPFAENQAQFSPDGRWIAYQSNPSGQTEVYIQAYPGPGIKRQVSSEGGTLPFWSHSGRELFYQTATAMFAVPIDTRDLHVGAPVRLFAKTSFAQAGGASPDDQRFLMLERADTNQSSQLNLVEHWFEDLKARVPTK